MGIRIVYKKEEKKEVPAKAVSTAICGVIKTEYERDSEGNCIREKRTLLLSS